MLESAKRRSSLLVCVVTSVELVSSSEKSFALSYKPFASIAIPMEEMPWSAMTFGAVFSSSRTTTSLTDLKFNFTVTAWNCKEINGNALPVTPPGACALNQNGIGTYKRGKLICPPGWVDAFRSGDHFAWRLPLLKASHMNKYSEVTSSMHWLLKICALQCLANAVNVAARDPGRSITTYKEVMVTFVASWSRCCAGLLGAL